MSVARSGYATAR